MSRVKKQIQLPDNFQRQVLALETKIQEKCTVDDISNLVSLYSSAIEFYESIHDNSYIDYEKKMHQILSRKDVLAVLNPKPKATPRPPLQNFNSPTNRLAEQRKVENTLKTYANDSLTARVMAQENLKKQENSFQKKLQERRNSRSKPCSREASTERPSIENFEQALEKLMEKLVTEKLKRTENVNNKYQKLMVDAKSAPIEERGRAIKEVEAERMREMKELNNRLEIERKLEISNLKSRYIRE